MKTILIVTSSIVVIMIILLSLYCILLKNQPWISDDDLEFIIELENDSISIHDWLNTTCILKNVGNDKIVFMNPFSITYYIFNGTQLMDKITPIVVQWIPRDNSQLRSIGPNENRTFEDEFESTEFDGLSINHTYQIQARFTSADCYRAWKPYWKGTVWSNSMNFTIQDK